VHKNSLSLAGNNKYNECQKRGERERERSTKSGLVNNNRNKLKAEGHRNGIEEKERERLRDVADR
jgi:hypothetical protein